MSDTAEPCDSVPRHLLGLRVPVVCLSERTTEACICFDASENVPVSFKSFGVKEEKESKVFLEMACGCSCPQLGAI